MAGDKKWFRMAMPPPAKWDDDGPNWDAFEWCQQAGGDGAFVAFASAFYFENEQDAVAFSLKWC